MENIKFKKSITAEGFEKYEAKLDGKSTNFQEIISNIIDGSLGSPRYGCIDIYTPPMWDGLYLGQYMKGDFIEMTAMTIVTSYFNYKVSYISAIRDHNHIDYHIYLKEKEN